MPKNEPAAVRDELRAIARMLERAVRLGEDDQVSAVRALRRLAHAVGADVLVTYPSVSDLQTEAGMDYSATARGL